MARLLKCYGTCGEKYEKVFLTNDGGKNYCERCLNKKHKDKEDRNSLYKLICELYDVTYPTGMMLKQIKQFREENGYTFKDIEYTLLYIRDYKNNIDFHYKYGISIVPYIIDEAKEYKIKVQEQMKSGGFEVNKEKSIVSIKPKTLNKKRKVTRKINMEDLI